MAQSRMILSPSRAVIKPYHMQPHIVNPTHQILQPPRPANSSHTFIPLSNHLPSQQVQQMASTIHHYSNPSDKPQPEPAEHSMLDTKRQLEAAEHNMIETKRQQQLEAAEHDMQDPKRQKLTESSDAETHDRKKSETSDEGDASTCARCQNVAEYACSRCREVSTF